MKVLKLLLGPDQMIETVLFTATKISRLLGRKGHFWPRASIHTTAILLGGPHGPISFQFDAGLNPVRINLKPGEYQWYSSRSA